MRKSIVAFSVFVLVPLFLGVFFYCAFCPEVYFVQLIRGSIGIPLRFFTCVSKNSMIKMLRGYLPDFLWGFSFSASIFLIIGNHSHSWLLSVLGVTFVGLVLEILQLRGVVSGTYALFDIAVECFGGFTGAILLKKYLEVKR